MSGKEVLQMLLSRAAADLPQKLLDEKEVATDICPVAGIRCSGMLMADARAFCMFVPDMDAALCG